jgi:hypothetical protein
MRVGWPCFGWRQAQLFLFAIRCMYVRRLFQLLVYLVQVTVFKGKSGRSFKLTTHIHPVLKLVTNLFPFHLYMLVIWWSSRG